MPTFIYHITHVDNLKSILADGRLCTYNELCDTGKHHISIAHQDIQDRRARIIVPCGPGGALHGYVPFQFAPRSPMLYTINRGNVLGYSDGQSPLLHLVSTIESVKDAALSFVFTNGHAIMRLTDFFDDLARLDQVDWELMRARYWYDTVNDSDRKRRRQAEFLVHKFFPWRLITEIGVINSQLGAQVTTLLQNSEHEPEVVIRPNWYY
jgi:hypothetical protein